MRHYHEAGLLQPEQVDARTGYRYYSVAQIPTAEVIRRFRELGMPGPCRRGWWRGSPATWNGPA